MDEDKEMRRNIERRGTEGWHLRKEVNVSHLLTTLTLVVGLVVWANKMDNRITATETINDRQDHEISTINKSIEVNLNVIREDVREIRNFMINGNENNQ